MNTAVIGLGSNIDARANIQRAKKQLDRKFRILAASCFRVTKPVGTVQQPDFINGCVFLETKSEFKDLRSALKALEIKLGRKRSANRFGPRVIDLDIVVWNRKVVDPDFYRREYLQRSVLELIPDLQYKGRPARKNPRTQLKAKADN